jgi:hypothetical protein
MIVSIGLPSLACVWKENRGQGRLLLDSHALRQQEMSQLDTPKAVVPVQPLPLTSIYAGVTISVCFLASGCTRVIQSRLHVSTLMTGFFARGRRMQQSKNSRQ